MTSTKPFKILCCDPFTGHMMDEHGIVVAKGADPVATFDDADDAKKYARELVARHPHVECHVIGPNGVDWEYCDEAWVAREVEARHASHWRFQQRSRLEGAILLVAALLLVVAASYWMLRQPN